MGLLVIEEFGLLKLERGGEGVSLDLRLGGILCGHFELGKGWLEVLLLSVFLLLGVVCD